jgi:hypothetical protein
MGRKQRDDVRQTPGGDTIFQHTFTDPPGPRWIDRYRRLRPKWKIPNKEYARINRKLKVQPGDVIVLGLEPRFPSVILLKDESEYRAGQRLWAE